MQAFHPGTGMTLEFPDNTPDEDIQQHFMNAQSNMPTTAPSVAQQFIDGARGAYEQQQLSPAPVNGAGFVGLDPQQAQFMLQQRQNQAAMQQQSASDQARNRIEQQKMMQQGLEGEKDRSLQINLHKQTLKNQIDQRKIDADRMKHELEWKTKLDMLKEAGATEEQLARLNKPENVSEGGALVKDGVEVYKNEKTFAPDRPSASDWEFQDKEDPITGKATRYRVNLLTGEEQLFGPVPSITSKRQGSSSGGRDDLSVSDSEKVLNRFDEQILKEPGYDTKNPDPAIEQKVLRRVRRELNVSAFQTDNDATEFINARAEALFQQEATNWPPEALNNEATVSFLQKKAMDQAEQERWEEDGYETRGRNKDGELIVLTPNGEDPRR